MSRKNLFEEVRKESNLDMNELKKIISSYNTNKSLESEYKDLASADNTRIKVMMEQMGISECEDIKGEVKAKVTEQKKESFIEDALIQLLKETGNADNIVKTKEYVDMEELESAIYHNKIPSDVVKQMDACKEVKVTKVLRLSKIKGGEK